MSRNFYDKVQPTNDKGDENLGLRVLEFLPEALLSAESTELVRPLGGPSLIHLKGRSDPPLFVSVLQHGNETTGWQAIQSILHKYAGKQLPRSLSILVANVGAAAMGVRRKDGEPDFNRCWPGGDTGEHAFYKVTRQVFDQMKKRGVFASVDLHNNTGLNPHYGAINRLDHRFFHLATLFSRTVVFFTAPRGVQSIAFSELCPSVTLECGQVGQSAALQHAIDYIEACLHLDHIPEKQVASHDMDLFQSLATIRIPEHLSFSFGPGNADISLASDLDHLNFRELPANTVFGHAHNKKEQCLYAQNSDGQDISREIFGCEDGQIRLLRPFMPAMLTLDHRIVRQDCLCYLMERIAPEHWQKAG